MVEEQLVSLGVDFLSAGITTGSGVGVSKARDVLRRRQFSEELGDVATVFNASLRTAIEEENARLDTNELEGVVEDWSAVAAELARLEAQPSPREKDQLDVVFADESDAVSRIAAAIGSAKGFDVDRTPALREALERAVTRAYREAIVEFEQRIAGTKLQDVFESETNLVLVDRLNGLQDRLSDLHDDVETLLTQTARDEGFVQLTPQYFARTALETPQVCWRTGFNHGEIKAGYHFERTHDDDGERTVTEVLVDRLRDGRNQAVIGPPGSGKSTVCKSVACTWYESLDGAVLYRERNATKPFEGLGALEDCIRKASGPVLVVVEDAASPDTSSVYRLIERFRGVDDVAFLLNARHSAWENPPEAVVADARLQEVRSSYVETYTVPSVTEHECERAIRRFETVTGTTVRQHIGQLVADIESTDVGEMYLLAYRLASEAAAPEATTEVLADESTTVLEAAVKRVYGELTSWGAEDDYLPLHLGLMVNVLNASDTGIHLDLLHSLAETDDDHRRIDELVGRLEGELLFEGDSGGYRSHHPLWSSIFFRHFLETEGDRRAPDHFETVVNALFSVVDDAETRERIQRWFRGEADYVRRIDDDPEAMADSLVLRVFNMGDTDPQFAFARASSNHRQPIFHVAPLFGTSEYSRIELPEACSDEVRLRCTNLRGVMYLDTGEFRRAQTEFEHLYEALETLDSIPSERRTEIEAWTLNNLGNVARRQGEFDDAETYHRRSLERFRETEITTGEAWTLNNLGNVNRLLGDLDTAESFHERSLAIFEELDNDLGRGWVLNNLGLVARIRGDLETASKRHAESREAFQSIGYQLGEARVLNALGLVAREREAYEDALRHHRASVQIAREIGDRQCVAWCCNNLGTVHERMGALDAARERYETSLEIKRDLGDQKGEANTLSNLATVAIRDGDLETARRRADESLEIFERIGMCRECLEKLETFAELCAEQHPETGSDVIADWCDRGVDLADEHGFEDRRTALESIRSAA